MSGAPPAASNPAPADDDGKPDGDEEKGHPNDERAQTETVLEEGMPEHQKRKPHTGADAEKG